MREYPHREDASYLLEGFKSVYGMEEVVQANIEKEVKEGRLLGPFEMAPLETLRVLSLVILGQKALKRVKANTPLVLLRGSIG